MSELRHVTFLFAPGAGAPSTHPWMQRWAKMLGTLGKVQTLDYPYMLAGSKRPDPLPKLIAAHRSAFARFNADDGEIVLIGKSMGGRVGCHVALEEKVLAVVCLGYPLCAGGDRSKLRDEVLRKLETPILFVQGTRDPLCPLDLLAEVRLQMKAINELHVVEGGNHSLQVSKAQLKSRNESQTAVDERIVRVIRDFLAKQPG